MIPFGISVDPPNESETRELLHLSLLPGLGPRTLTVLLQRFGTAGDVLRADRGALMSVPGVGEKLSHTIRTATDHVDLDSVVGWCERHGAEVWVRGHERYPEPLEDLPDPPPVLFARGDWKQRDAIAVAIVGTRHATAYGLQQTRRLSLDLANAGVTIVSGLARGIDTAAHRAAIEAGGRTIAFLGGGLGKMYPAENAGLADEIAETGAVISEASPLSQPRGVLFPQRNRLIAALSLATIVIEAPSRSGSLITARVAGELGRGVGALPGSVVSRASRGCHELIRDGGTLVTCADDVLEMLGPLEEPIAMEPRSGESADGDLAIRSARELTLNDVERNVLSFIETTGTSIDAVTAACRLPASRVAAVLSILEMKSFVRRTSGQYVSRI